MPAGMPPHIKWLLTTSTLSLARSVSAVEGGKAKGLPSGVALSDLVPVKAEPIPPTHDSGNPEILCEFFDTRQVRRPKG